jgi:release factor glutamine methyltransferase
VVTQRAALKDAVKRLKDAGIEMPVLDARLLVEHALATDWATLFTGPDRDLSAEEAGTVESHLQRRLAREPVSRIVGKRGFWKFDLAISPDTLDPRPDTETLIMAVLKLVPDPAAPLSILDLGTGSGAILLALLNELPHATGLGIDVLPGAVATASANALAVGLHDRADFRNQDWNQTIERQFDIVVSNPPYIPAGNIPGLAAEVRNYDPHAALNGGPDGLDAYRAIAALLPGIARPGGLVALEIGQGQADTVEAIFADADCAGFRRWQDLAQIDRAVTCHTRVRPHNGVAV